LRLDVAVKPILRVDGRPVVGPGRYRLLKAVDEEGTLKGAAERVGWSYEYARRSVRAIEEVVGEPVVVTERGGSGGGRAVLTETGKKLVREYERALERIRGAGLDVIL